MDGLVDYDRVHLWVAGSVKEPAAASIARINAVLALFALKDAEIAEIVSGSVTFSFVHRLGSRIHAIYRSGPNPVRIVIVRPLFRGIIDVGPELQPGTLPDVTWKDGVPNAKIVVEDISPWVEKRITVAEFDRIWNSPDRPSPEKELKYAREKGATEEDLVRIIRSYADSL
jgi:hypothetical protein